MRLINVNSFALEEFHGSHVPGYLILSHTWGEGEVTLQRFQDPDAHEARGYSKIKAACAITGELGYHYIWVDTCCIDKTSSVELSEAINSMFQYYEQAKDCLAYLADVVPGEDDLNESLSKARWFTRGWTLQELLASRHVTFYASDWSKIGTRDTLASQISCITGIDKIYLFNAPNPTTGPVPFPRSLLVRRTRSSLLRRASVAERMSWAARRCTTREEDKAYCLLGIFGINMALLYGEGTNAFMRLQQEIIQKYSDPTLLAWNTIIDGHVVLPGESTDSFGWSLVWKMLRLKQHAWSASVHPDDSDVHGLWSHTLGPPPKSLLAPSPDHFEGCQDIVSHDIPFDWSLTTNGLRLRLPTSDNPFPRVVLPCYSRHNPTYFIAIRTKYDPINKAHSRASGPLLYVHLSKWHMWRPEGLLLRTDSEQHQSHWTNDHSGYDLQLYIKSPTMDLLESVQDDRCSTHIQGSDPRHRTLICHGDAPVEFLLTDDHGESEFHMP
ncbi:vacuolar protein sorting protein 62 [Apiospora arundinis]